MEDQFWAFYENLNWKRWRTSRGNVQEQPAKIWRTARLQITSGPCSREKRRCWARSVCKIYGSSIRANSRGRVRRPISHEWTTDGTPTKCAPYIVVETTIHPNKSKPENNTNLPPCGCIFYEYLQKIFTLQLLPWISIVVIDLVHKSDRELLERYQLSASLDISDTAWEPIEHPQYCHESPIECPDPANGKSGTWGRFSSVCQYNTTPLCR